MKCKTWNFMDRVNLGIIGATGFAAEKPIPAFQQAGNVRVSYLYGRDPKKTANVANQYGVEKWTNELEELLADKEVDAVYVVSPAFLHAEHTEKAAKAGKDVLCEKPMATTTDECHRMIDVCERNDSTLMMAFMLRFHPAHRRIKKLLENNAIGRVVSARAQLSLWFPQDESSWRQKPDLSGGGAIADVGSHCIDLLRFFLGDIDQVSAQAPSLYFEYDVDDTSILLVRFESGEVGIIDAYFNLKKAENRLELYGTGGSIVAERTIGPYREASFQLSRPSEQIDYQLDYINPYEAEVRHFAHSVLERSEPEVTGEDGLRCQQIIEASLKSHSEGARIKVNSGI